MNLFMNLEEIKLILLRTEQLEWYQMESKKERDWARSLQESLKPIFQSKFFNANFSK